MPTRTPTLASAPEGSMAGTVRKVGGGGGQGRAGRGWEGRVRSADRAERAPPTLNCCSSGSCVAQLPCVGPARLPLPQVLLVQLVVLLCGPLVTTWFSSEPRLMPASWSSAPGPHTPLWASCCPRLSREQRPSVALPGSIFCSHGGPEGRSLSPLSFCHAYRRKRVFPKRSLLCLGSLHMWPRTFIFNKGIQNGAWGGSSFWGGGWNLGMQSVRPCRVWDGGERRAEDSRQAPFLLQVAPKNVEEAEGLNSSVGL